MHTCNVHHSNIIIHHNPTTNNQHPKWKIENHNTQHNAKNLTTTENFIPYIIKLRTDCSSSAKTLKMWKTGFMPSASRTTRPVLLTMSSTSMGPSYLTTVTTHDYTCLQRCRNIGPCSIPIPRILTTPMISIMGTFPIISTCFNQSNHDTSWEHMRTIPIIPIMWAI